MLGGSDRKVLRRVDADRTLMTNNVGGKLARICPYQDAEGTLEAAGLAEQRQGSRR